MKITITVNGTEQTLDLNKAKELYDELDRIFGERKHIGPAPCPYPDVQPWKKDPIAPYDPMAPYPFWCGPQVFCGKHPDAQLY